MLIEQLNTIFNDTVGPDEKAVRKCHNISSCLSNHHTWLSRALPGNERTTLCSRTRMLCAHNCRAAVCWTTSRGCASSRTRTRSDSSYHMTRVPPTSRRERLPLTTCRYGYVTGSSWRTVARSFLDWSWNGRRGWRNPTASPPTLPVSTLYILVCTSCVGSKYFIQWWWYLLNPVPWALAVGIWRVIGMHSGSTFLLAYTYLYAHLLFTQIVYLSWSVLGTVTQATVKLSYPSPLKWWPSSSI